MYQFTQYCDDSATDTLKTNLENAFNFLKKNGSLFELITDPCRIYFDLDIKVPDDWKAEELDKTLLVTIAAAAHQLFREEAYIACSHGKKNNFNVLSYHVILPIAAQNKSFIKNHLVDKFNDALEFCFKIAAPGKKFPENVKADPKPYSDGIQKFRCIGSRKAFRNEEKENELGDKKDPRICKLTDPATRETTELNDLTYGEWGSTVISNVEELPYINEKDFPPTIQIKEPKSPQNNDQYEPMTVEILRRIADNIDGKKFSSYDKWFPMLCTIKNVQLQYNLPYEECLNAADTISSHAANYKGKEDIDACYNRIAPNGKCGAGSLWEWIRQDNRKVHDELREEQNTVAIVRKTQETFGDMLNNEIALTTDGETDVSSVAESFNSSVSKQIANIPITPSIISNVDIGNMTNQEFTEIRKLRRIYKQEKEQEEMAAKRDAIKKKANDDDMKNAPRFNYNDPYDYHNFALEFQQETKFKTEIELLESFVKQSRKVIMHVNNSKFIRKNNVDKNLKSEKSSELENFQLYVAGKKYKMLKSLVPFMRNIMGFKTDPQNKNPMVLDVYPSQPTSEVKMTTEELEKKVKPMKDYLLEVWANGNNEIFNYLLQWSKCVLKRSTEKTNAVIYLFGTHGAGKNTYVDFLRQFCLGYPLAKSTTLNKLLDKHSNNIESAKLIVLEELNAHGSRKEDFETFKDLVTNDTLEINPKGQDMRSIVNMANFVIPCNHADAIIIAPTERRYLVVKCSDKYVGNTEYWNKMRTDCFNQDFANCWYTYLMKHESKVDLKIIPMTEERKNLIENCLHHSVIFALDWVRYEDKQARPLTISSSIFYKKYQEYAKENGYHSIGVYDQRKLKNELTKYGMTTKHSKVGNVYIFTNFAVANVPNLKIEKIEEPSIPVIDLDK